MRKLIFSSLTAAAALSFAAFDPASADGRPGPRQPMVYRSSPAPQLCDGPCNRLAAIQVCLQRLGVREGEATSRMGADGKPHIILTDLAACRLEAEGRLGAARACLHQSTVASRRNQRMY